MIEHDIRDTGLFREVDSAAREIWQVGTGAICDAADLAVSPCGRTALFTATVVDALEGTPATQIFEIELKSGALRQVVAAEARARMPSYAPTAGPIAYLTDRAGDGAYQLEFAVANGSTLTAQVEGWVDQFAWSEDGRSLLALVADHGADRAGVAGAMRSADRSAAKPAWMPTVHRSGAPGGKRRLWIVDSDTGEARPADCASLNVWEATWCGADRIVAVVSEGSTEGDWYGARLTAVGLQDGTVTTLFEPVNQLGSPAVSRSGRVAVVEAVCSDRCVVAGTLILIDPEASNVRRVNTCGVDVTNLAWLNDDRLMFAGHRGFETVVGLVDARSLDSTLIWVSDEIGSGGPFATVAAVGSDGDFALIAEGFRRPPEIAMVQEGQYRTLLSLGPESSLRVPVVEKVEWGAPDGLRLQGWLLRPEGQGPYPTILNVHGGPVWHWRPRWLGRFVGFQDLMLVARGYAIFLPNPRGSTGRGEAFAAKVRGDVGGADASDHLSGIDHLVTCRIADPARIGVCGGSYGGYMAAWLVTQDTRFAAAVSVAPIINPVTEHLLSSVPQFTRLFFEGGYLEPGSHYYSRSPLLHVGNTRTPTLLVCGARDRVTPPEEAAQFHTALVEHGVESMLVTYPSEGHGVRSWPAFTDYVARVIGWFEWFMPAETGPC